MMNVWDQQIPFQKYRPDVDMHKRKLWNMNQQKGGGLVVIFLLFK